MAENINGEGEASLALFVTAATSVDLISFQLYREEVAGGAENITLLPLPPYSLGLTPTERLWRYMPGRELRTCLKTVV